MQPSSRRRVLAALLTGTIGSVAGCSSPDDGTGTERPGTATESSTTPPTTARTESTTAGEDDPTETTTVSDAERVAIAKTVAQELKAGEFEAVHDRLVESSAAEISTSELERVWARASSSLGEYRGATVTDQGTTANDRPYVVLRLSFESGGLRLVTTYRGDAIVGLAIRPAGGSYEPPAYADDSAVVERSVTVPSPACDLGGTLTLPASAVENDGDGSDGDGTVPGVVLVHGSGPNGRDQSIGPNKPFKDLALGLATNGVAVLRYDKRTHTCDVSRADGLDLDDLTVDDAVAALDVLREQPEVDAVTVVGHSQGGYAAPRIAAATDVDGMVGLAAPSGSIAELVEIQVQYLSELDGEISQDERERIEEVEAAVERIQADEYGSGETLLGYHANFWSDVASYDPPAVAADLDIPTLLAFGGRDYQVPVDRARPAWADHLGDDPATTLETYDALNHLLIPGTGTPTPDEYFESGSVAEALVADLAAWTTDL